MLRERIHEALFGVVLLALVGTAVGGAVGTPTTVDTQRIAEQHGQLLQVQENNTTSPQPRPMSATTSRTGSNSFRVDVRDASIGQSDSVEPPSGIGNAGYNTDLRSMQVSSRGGSSQFSLDVSVARSLGSLSTAEASSGPSSFDTTLMYTQVESDADSNDFDVTYNFDVETDFLQEQNARRDGIQIAVYRDGGWETLSDTTTSNSGNETLAEASIAGPTLVAVGLQHPNITVERIAVRDSPAVANKTSRLEVTVRNRGSRDGQRTLNITGDDQPLSAPTISVAAGSRRTVTVPVNFSRADEIDVEAGEYETEITVVEPTPNITVRELSVSQTQIQTGDTIEVSATVINVGTGGGVGNAEFQAFGQVVSAKQVRLAPGQSRTVQFSQQFEAPGTYTVGVNNETTTVTVRRGPDWESSPTESSGTITGLNEDSGNDESFQWALMLLGGGIVLLFGAVIVGRLLTE